MIVYENVIYTNLSASFYDSVLEFQNFVFILRTLQSGQFKT